MDYNNKYSNPNPKLSANILSKITFSWLVPLFWYGRKKELKVKDIYEVLPEHESEYLGEILDRWWQEEVKEMEKRQCKPSLFRAVRRSFFWSIIHFAFIFIAGQMSLSILNPMIIDFYVKHFGTKASVWNGIGCATLVTLNFFTSSFLAVYSQFKLRELGMRVKIACSSLIYRKMTRLSGTAMTKIDEGHIINLLADDVLKWEQFFMYVHYGWLSPILSLGVIFIMLEKTGTVVLILGIAVFVLQILPVQGAFNCIIYRLRLKAATATDQRILLIKEMFNGIKVVKMYTWEKPFEKIVLSLRKKEIKWLKFVAYIKAVSISISGINACESLFVTIIAYFFIEGKLMASENIFSNWRYFISLHNLTFDLPYAVNNISETRAAVKRIEEMQNTIQYYPKNDNNDCSVSIEGVNVSWDIHTAFNVLSNINIKLLHGQVYVVIGPTGAGKSSLLKLILGELHPNAGRISMYGRVSYSSQEPWLFSGSVKSNIICGETYDAVRYKNVLNACALTEDFNQLAYGDSTLVGDGGLVLSGGQRTRVNLARALYRKADIYLLDDCLSAVDASVGKIIYEKCFKVFLKQKTCILVTHNLQYTDEKDQIILMDKGMIKYQGTFANFKKDKKYYFFEQSRNTEDFENKSTTSNKISDENVKIHCNEQEDNSSESDQLMTQTDESRETQDLMVKGNVAKILYWNFFKSSGCYWKLFMATLTLLLAQICITVTDFWIPYMSKLNTTDSSTLENGTTTLISSENNNHDVVTALYIYGLLLVGIITATFSQNLLLFNVCMNASKNIHNKMFTRLLNAPLTFFYENNIGRIINRFSQDTGMIDEQLSVFLINTIRNTVIFFALLLVICISKWWTILPTIAIVIIAIKMQQIYQKTAKYIKRFEAIAKEPVFSNVNSSFTGLVTIRSSQLQETVYEEFTQLQNHHTSAYYLVLAGMTIIKLWTEYLKDIFVAFLSFGFLFTNNSSSSVNLIFTQISAMLSTIEQAMKWYTEVLADVINLERMFQFTEVKQEHSLENHAAKKSVKYCYSEGRIQIDNLCLKYFDAGRPVLKNLNFSIEPGQKIGIVGRTGAGKSSLIAALFRLVDFDGSIYIDNVNIKEQGLHDVRSNISVIPQESLLFTMTLRENLDPCKEYTDQTIWSALKDVGLHHMYTSLDVLLDKKNLSMGQIQLLSLARVIIKKNKIVVLDEAAANVDNETNITVQNIIKNKFKDCTVIYVAHRLNTIIDSDKVLVLDNGQLLEFDHPYILLQKEGGAFQRMVLQSNDADYGKLQQIAKDVWMRKQESS